MTLHDAADLATSLTLLVATVTFILAFVEHRQRQTEARIRAWQRVVIYKIIEKGSTQFDDIKQRYVTEAQILSSIRLPKEEIKDDALQLVLLGMISDRLIAKTAENSNYRILAVSNLENDFTADMKREWAEKRRAEVLLAKAFELLETSSGQFTVDQLYRKLEGDKDDVRFEIFNFLMRIEANRGTLGFRDDKVWLRHKLPRP